MGLSDLFNVVYGTLCDFSKNLSAPTPTPVTTRVPTQAPTQAPVIDSTPPVSHESESVEKSVIDMIDVVLLKIAAPSTSTNDLQGWVDPIQKACRRFNIDTVREVACFLAQSSHESGGFTHIEENLNYSAQRLRQVWPKRFPTLSVANQYARNPQRLANYVYANRMGNGPSSTGDGWKFRGAGLFQLTGRSNYTRFARAMGLNPNMAADWVRTKDGAAMSAAWYFDDRGLDRLAATPGVEDETRAINGGLLGVAERREHFNAIVNELLKRGA